LRSRRWRRGGNPGDGRQRRKNEAKRAGIRCGEATAKFLFADNKKSDRLRLPLPAPPPEFIVADLQHRQQFDQPPLIGPCLYTIDDWD
jgi:hypothetical protein